MRSFFLPSCLSALAVLSSLSPTASSPVVQQNQNLEIRTLPSLPVAVTTVHQFEFPAWCENLAVRCNGQILVTRLDTPELIQVDPTGAVAPITIATWDGSYYKGALGITETVDDVFFVALAAPIDANFVKTSGIPAVYKVNMTTFQLSSSGTVLSNATVTKLTDLVTCDFPNGMTTLDYQHVLLADAYNGWVYKINTKTGAYSIAIDDPKMKFPANASSNLGVNGLKIRDSELFWTNTGNATFNKLNISSTAAPIGTSSVVAEVQRPDDFVFKWDGTAFITQDQFDELSVLEPGSATPTVIAGSPTSTTLAGVTAGEFGRLPSDAHLLYLTTNGGKSAAFGA